jgi:hypothetical protein
LCVNSLRFRRNAQQGKIPTLVGSIEGSKL